VTEDLVLARVAVALDRGHALFSKAPLDAGADASGSSQTLTTLSNRVASTPQTLDASGQFANAYAHVAQQLSRRLSRTAALDARLSAVISEAASAEAAGRNQSGNVVVNAAADTARTGPYTDTPAGRLALLIALRNRVDEQRQVISAFKTRDADLAATVRQLNYPNTAVPYQPPPPTDDTSAPCWIGTADGDIAALCPSNTDTVTYVDDAGNYVSKNLRTGELTIIFEPGADPNDTGSCWLPSADADRSICGPGTTHWRYPHNGNLITEELQPSGEIKVIFRTPLGPLIP
jgi:hypothetical protein